MFSKKKLGEKIKKLRNDHDLSQEELAQKIGISRVAISQLEVGKRGMDALELVKLSEIFNIDSSSFLRDDEQIKNEIKKITGKNKFKLDNEKLRNVILYILERCGGKPNLGETVLYKLLYFVDFNSYEKFGEPVTGINYIKLQFGPVPRAKEYNQLVSLMMEGKELEIISQNYHGMIQKRYIALENSNLSILSEQDKNIINEVVIKYSDMSAREIEDYVHGDAPWRESENQQVIDYNLVFNRTSPYAHRNYKELFRDSSAKDILKDLGPISKKEVEYYENL